MENSPETAPTTKDCAMLTITEDASTQLTRILDTAPDETVVRLVAAQEGLAVQFGETLPGDTTFDVGDKTVLALDAAVNDALADKTLDVQSTADGPQLLLR